ncbi:unnamed protein product [Cylicocyclus nassatus]|uniref:DUF5641 domain-containing protein n=1 Tax=Cylicocyclus nassatus TaxID=53992 RepID=A0AA36GU56_CYLNA|nr:unnamed protein product [Cylicocyclus nassatus]
MDARKNNRTPHCIRCLISWKNELSLNDVVYEGHALTPLIHEVLLLFRTYKNTMVADIQKAFLQIRLPEHHRDATRFLWIKDLHNPAEGPNVKYYRFCRVPFGINASPAILNQCILKHIEEGNSPIGKELSKSLYVDNVLLEGNSTAELVDKYMASKQIFSSIGMNLRDYLSNCKDVNDNIKESDRAKGPDVKVLGLKWKAADDTLLMECVDKEHAKVTKRTVLSQINGFCFDPLGLLTPLMIPAKIFLQDIHKQKLGWDVPLPQEEAQKWKTIKEDIVGFKKSIPRRVLHKTPDAEHKLAVFVDSSKRAYACCLYVTTVENGKMVTTLFTAKAKVAPIKKEQTIPRLELLSIFLGLSVAETTMSKCGIKFTEVNLFSDSTIALSWIGSNKKLPPIVTTLVQKIGFAAGRIGTAAKLNFFHVPTEENSADCATRGIDKHGFYGCKWWKGPNWLNYPNEHWPVRCISNIDTSEHEECEMLTNQTVEHFETSDWPVDSISSYPKLKRIVAYCLRFIRSASKNTRFKIAEEEQVKTLPPNAAEIILAEKYIILQEQRVFGTTAVSNNKQFKTIYDTDGILRKCGRIQHADVRIDTANPMYKTIGRRKLTEELLQTSLCEIEGILNSRPLTYIGDDGPPCKFLRPIDFIYKDVRLGTTQLIPTDNDDEDPDYRITPELISQKEARQALSETEKLTKKFWSIWKHDYLLELRDRHHIFQKGRKSTKRNPQIGDVVLIDEDSQLNRGFWPMAVIIELVPSRDGEIRSVILRNSSGRTIQRPLTRLIPLEIESTMDTKEGNTEPTTKRKDGLIGKVKKVLKKKTTETSEVRKQPQRAAKKPVNYSSSNASVSNKSAHITTSLMLSICMITMFFSNVTSAAELSCLDHGVQINTTFASDSELCLNYQDCLRITTKKGLTEVALPIKHRMADHSIQWRTLNGTTQHSDTIICPAGNVCDMIRCIFCLDFFSNPHCAPNTAITIAAVCTYLMIMLLWFICCIGLQGTKLLRRGNDSDVQHTQPVEDPNQQDVGLIEIPTQQWQKRRPIQSKMITFVAIIACLFQRSESCQYTHTLSSNNTICTKTADTFTCRYSMENRITLSEHRPQACFRIQHQNETMGSMEIQLQHVILQCNPVVLYYTRDAHIVTESAKRCHFSGSCSSNTCAHTSQRTYIPELQNTYDFPGVARCTSSCGSIGCGCLLPMPGCLFSRSYAKPQSETIYQILHCPTWEESAVLKYTYISAKGEKESTTLTVTAQTAKVQKNANITMEFVTTPLIPLLSTIFLQTADSTTAHTAMVDKDEIFALRCPTLESSKNLSLCHVEDTCKCFPTDDEANCQCKNTNITDLITSLDSRLPLSSSFLQLQEANGRIFAVSHKSVIDLSLTTAGEWNTANIVNNEDCDITASPIQGCYNCLSGAKLTFSCRSSHPAMVEITCQRNVFAAFCNEHTVQTIALLQSTVARYSDQCLLRCGKNIHNFNITGILAYNPHQDAVHFFNETDEALYVNMYNYPDVMHMISVALSSWKFTIAAAIAIIALIAFTVFCLPKIIAIILC